MAAQVLERVRIELQVELPLQALFENPTVAGLAAQIEKASAGLGAAGSAAPGEMDLQRALRQLGRV